MYQSNDQKYTVILFNFLYLFFTYTYNGTYIHYKYNLAGQPRLSASSKTRRYSTKVLLGPSLRANSFLKMGNNSKPTIWRDTSDFINKAQQCTILNSDLRHDQYRDSSHSPVQGFDYIKESVPPRQLVL